MTYKIACRRLRLALPGPLDTLLLALLGRFTYFILKSNTSPEVFNRWMWGTAIVGLLALAHFFIPPWRLKLLPVNALVALKEKWQARYELLPIPDQKKARQWILISKIFICIGLMVTTVTNLVTVAALRDADLPEMACGPVLVFTGIIDLGIVCFVTLKQKPMTA